MKVYRKRVADDILKRKLEGKGAVLIEGPKWCGKTTTAEQIPREDSALGLPLGMGTKIVCKHNLRNLIDMSHQRECSRAYHEYRGLFADVGNALREYSDEWAYLVDHYFMPKCEYFGFCREKKMYRKK